MSDEEKKAKIAELSAQMKKYGDWAGRRRPVPPLSAALFRGRGKDCPSGQLLPALPPSVYPSVQPSGPHVMPFPSGGSRLFFCMMFLNTPVM